MEELYDKWITQHQKKDCIRTEHKSPARLGLTNMRGYLFILVN